MALRPKKPQSRDEQLAERDNAQQEVFIREVDDALREDEMLGALKRFGRPAAYAVVLGLTALAGYLGWNHMQTRKAGERGEQLTLALDSADAGRLDKSAQQLETLTQDSADGPKAAAQLLRAAIAYQQGHRDQATKLYAAVSADESAPKPYREIATIREVATNFDTMPPQRVVDRLKALAVPGNPWFGSAGEMVGIAYMKQGRNDLAGPLFAAISRDKDVPETLRNRARQMAGLLGVDAIDDPTKAATAGLQ